MIAGIDVYSVRNLRVAFTFLTGDKPLTPLREDLTAFFAAEKEPKHLL